MSHYFENDNNLKNMTKTIKYQINNQTLKFETNSGIFSRKEIDFGSDLLIRNFIEKNPIGSILDLGCGYGFMGLTLAKLTVNKVDMVDINERAVLITSNNAKLNNVTVECFVSDGFVNVKQKYDYILSNPPIRIGKEKLYALLFAAKDYLKEGGELWLVVRKEQGAKSLMKDLENSYKVDIITKNKGFYIIRALIA